MVNKSCPSALNWCMIPKYINCYATGGEIVRQKANRMVCLM